MARGNDNEGRRLIYDDEDKEVYTNLLNSSNPFKKLSILDLFAIALIQGKKLGIRTELGDGKVGRVRKSTIDGTNVRYLMMAIAADEERAIDVLTDEDKYFTICEEYAKTGINLLNSKVLDKRFKLLDDMEEELLDFYEKFIADN